MQRIPDRQRNRSIYAMNNSYGVHTPKGLNNVSHKGKHTKKKPMIAACTPTKTSNGIGSSDLPPPPPPRPPPHRSMAAPKN